MASEREKLLKDLAVSYDVFMELTGNLEEGTKVYNLTLANISTEYVIFTR